MKFLEKYPKYADGFERLKRDLFGRYQKPDKKPIIITDNLDEELKKLKKKLAKVAPRSERGVETLFRLIL